jgi:hypothetical protein
MYASGAFSLSAAPTCTARLQTVGGSNTADAPKSRHPGNPLSKRPQFRKQVPSVRCGPIATLGGCAQFEPKIDEDQSRVTNTA